MLHGQFKKIISEERRCCISGKSLVFDWVTGNGKIMQIAGLDAVKEEYREDLRDIP